MSVDDIVQLAEAAALPQEVATLLRVAVSYNIF